jgi:TfoX/Sxy family transcriptional regulator of competence genes
VRQPQHKLALVERVRATLSGGEVSEKRMFGGVTFLVNGNMLCCVFEHGLMVRVGKDAEASALSKPFVRPLSKTRKMSGFVFVEPDGLPGEAELSHWLRMAHAYVDMLPSKAPERRRGGQARRPV